MGMRKENSMKKLTLRRVTSELDEHMEGIVSDERTLVFGDEVVLATSLYLDIADKRVRDTAIALAYGDKVKNGDLVLLNRVTYSMLVRVDFADA